MRCKIIEVDSYDAYQYIFGKTLCGQTGIFRPFDEEEEERIGPSNFVCGDFYLDKPLHHQGLEYTKFFFAAVKLEPIPLNGTPPKEVEG